MDAMDVTAPMNPPAEYYEQGTTAERWARAQLFFDAKEYANAARVLVTVTDEAPEQLAPRLLLARAYYHSAQLSRAERELRALLERWPVEDYARLLLGRTLERAGRADEARPHLRMAAAMAGEFPE
ncbi:tetratricopeptide repeat protein [Streptomyces sp. NBC_00249]|uniref:tetratricopeptide repeat protein n=1 Tax=Streptomyces sp. NBC_00249 TaxID=2975690 RepID=UPI002256EFCF|nr:tetratricopeptide repeat protein [Streptomyces sp. NBC_00249]MCX5192917.1 tetratricopeptide repeat protein [Streptomyces sp. NBC_00249]